MPNIFELPSSVWEQISANLGCEIVGGEIFSSDGALIGKKVGSCQDTRGKFVSLGITDPSFAEMLQNYDGVKPRGNTDFFLKDC